MSGNPMSGWDEWLCNVPQNQIPYLPKPQYMTLTDNNQNSNSQLQNTYNSMLCHQPQPIPSLNNYPTQSHNYPNQNIQIFNNNNFHQQNRNEYHSQYNHHFQPQKKVQKTTEESNINQPLISSATMKKNKRSKIRYAYNSSQFEQQKKQFSTAKQKPMMCSATARKAIKKYELIISDAPSDIRYREAMDALNSYHCHLHDCYYPESERNEFAIQVTSYQQWKQLAKLKFIQLRGKPCAIKAKPMMVEMKKEINRKSKENVDAKVTFDQVDGKEKSKSMPILEKIEEDLDSILMEKIFGKDEIIEKENESKKECIIITAEKVNDCAKLQTKKLMNIIDITDMNDERKKINVIKDQRNEMQSLSKIVSFQPSLTSISMEKKQKMNIKSKIMEKERSLTPLTHLRHQIKAMLQNRNQINAKINHKSKENNSHLNKYNAKLKKYSNSMMPKNNVQHKIRRKYAQNMSKIKSKLIKSLPKPVIRQKFRKQKLQKYSPSKLKSKKQTLKSTMNHKIMISIPTDLNSNIKYQSRQFLVLKLRDLSYIHHPQMLTSTLKSIIMEIEHNIKKRCKYLSTYKQLGGSLLNQYRKCCNLHEILLQSQPKKRKIETPLERLMMTDLQLQNNEYPNKIILNEDSSFVPSPNPGMYHPRRMKSDILAIDCEMCATEVGNELTRISIVDSKLMVIYDKLVMPSMPIIDYLSQWSGITAELMVGVTLTLEQMHEDLWYFMDSNTILVGHSLENDLRAMKMVHHRVIDTAVLYMQHVEYKNKRRGHHWRSSGRKSSLKFLCAKYLDKEIQNNGTCVGHSSVEDATVSMQLAQLKLKSEEDRNQSLGRSVPNSMTCYLPKHESLMSEPPLKKIKSEMKTFQNEIFSEFERKPNTTKVKKRSKISEPAKKRKYIPSQLKTLSQIRNKNGKKYKIARDTIVIDSDSDSDIDIFSNNMKSVSLQPPPPPPALVLDDMNVNCNIPSLSSPSLSIDEYFMPTKVIKKRSRTKIKSPKKSNAKKEIGGKSRKRKHSQMNYSVDESDHRRKYPRVEKRSISKLKKNKKRKHLEKENHKKYREKARRILLEICTNELRPVLKQKKISRNMYSLITKKCVEQILRSSANWTENAVLELRNGRKKKIVQFIKEYVKKERISTIFLKAKKY